MYKYLGNQFKLEGAPFELAKDTYEGLITDILTARAELAGTSIDSNTSYLDKIINWLNENDFYDAPASTRYHENFKHGLLFHTLRVYNEMVDLIALPKFNSIQLQSAALVCLVHDWCKIGMYESYQKNVKNEVTGQWEKQLAYKYKDQPHPFGHGVASMYIAMKLFKLTEEEALAIRFHMGLWDCGDYDKNCLTYSEQNYPLVHLLQYADQLSICNY